MATSAPKKHRSSQSTPSKYTLRVELAESEPLIWRRLHIDGRVRLNALHHVLQAAMGWKDAHLHEFRIRDAHYCPPDPEWDNLDMPRLDEKKFRLNQLLGTGDTFTYLYDFGDSWSHLITVEAIDDVDDRSASSGNAWIEAGDLACPPEDSGGIWQYKDFLKKFEDNPYGEDTKDTRVWAGLDFDPDLYDRYAANAAIARMLWNGWIKIGA